jgi:hypothetical protein
MTDGTICWVDPAVRLGTKRDRGNDPELELEVDQYLYASLSTNVTINNQH